MTTTDTRHPEERAQAAFGEAVRGNASPGELARLYGTWKTVAAAAVNAEDGRAAGHHHAWRERAEEWSRLWNQACVLGWRREDGVRMRNLTAAEFAAQAPTREQWKRDAAAYLDADDSTVTTVDGDLLGAPPQPGPPPPRRWPVMPGPYQEEIHKAANGA